MTEHTIYWRAIGNLEDAGSFTVRSRLDWLTYRGAVTKVRRMQRARGNAGCDYIVVRVQRRRVPSPLADAAKRKAVVTP